MVDEAELSTHGEEVGRPLGEVGGLQHKRHRHVRLDGDGIMRGLAMESPMDAKEVALLIED